MPTVADPRCEFMGQLIALLGDFPARRDRPQAEVVATRLDRLEHEARWHGAPEQTLAAIKGAKLLLELAELPPLPRVAR